MQRHLRADLPGDGLPLAVAKTIGHPAAREHVRLLPALREAVAPVARGVVHYADPDANVIEKSLSPAAKEKLKKALADEAK